MGNEMAHRRIKQVMNLSKVRYPQNKGLTDRQKKSVKLNLLDAGIIFTIITNSKE